MTFQSLERGNYQFFQCPSTCQWPNVPLTEPTNSFLLKLTETRKSIRKVLPTNIVQPAQNHKPVHFATNKISSFYDCKKCDACSQVLKNPFPDQKPTILLIPDDGTHCFAKKMSCDCEKGKPFPFSKKFVRQSQSSTPKRLPKKAKIIRTMA